jgi:hypothetical protein
MWSLSGEPQASDVAGTTGDIGRFWLMGDARRGLDGLIGFAGRLHLGDPGLSPTSVAVACSVSTRQVHQLFEQRGRLSARSSRPPGSARSAATSPIPNWHT